MNRSKTTSDGTIMIDFQFEGELDVLYPTLFHAIPNSPHSLLLGQPFLDETKTMMKHPHRIVKRVVSVKRDAPLRVCYQGTADTPPSEVPQVNGYLNAQEESPVADTGSEVNVMSLSYAEAKGFEIDRGPGSREILCFANGTKERTVGKVRTMWQFQGSSDKYYLTFEVLDRPCFDLVLGQDFLHETDAFTQYVNVPNMPTTMKQKLCVLACVAVYFVNTIVRETRNLKFWKKKKNAPTLSPNEKEELEEQDRIRQNTLKIEKIADPVRRKDAEKAEKRRQEEWRKDYLAKH
ncbi:hypothetical protein LQ346_006781 [Neofusicoccum parvum]|nr:hypothetical protein LQ346_006781 [Neofusicoccum parvum]